MSLKIHDTMTGEKRPFEPLEPNRVRMYVCGVTPYARSHLGHARCYVAYDVIYRYLVYAGYEVTYVRNFTDVDDKIIARANERGISATEVAEENIAAYYADMDALGVARPHHEPRVSGSIPAIIDLVRRLEERGFAYTADGDVYYAVEKFSEYGKLSKRGLDEMLAGARVEVNERKRNPMDFALWKAAKPGEPSWESPWGPGRPGWHIECSAMSMGSLGETFDLHGGGRDLVFPHHENEIAQSEGATGKPYARFWLHNGFVNIDDQKMSKSIGNVFDIAGVCESYEPLVLRYFLLSTTHYRNPVNFSEALLEEAAARVAYFYETLRKVDALLAEDLSPPEGPLPHAAFIDGFEARFREAMDDDFNMVRAIEPVCEAFKLLNELVTVRKAARRAAAAASARRIRGLIERVDAVFQVFGEPPAEFLARHRDKALKRSGLDAAWIETRIRARLAAREGRDWAAADAIRDALAAKGVVLMDGPGCTDWTIREGASES